MDENSYEALKSAPKSAVPKRVEVLVAVERRRPWSVEQKLRFVRETLEPGVTTKSVAERHGLSTGLLYTWRKQMLTTAMAGFMPVQVTSEAPAPVVAAPIDPPIESPPAQDVVPGGVIEVQWSSNREPSQIRPSIKHERDVV
jgi:transposase